jgi:hypothetical protein
MQIAREQQHGPGFVDYHRVIFTIVEISYFVFM